MNIWTILCKFVAYFTQKESLGQHAKCPLPSQIRHIHAEVHSEYVIIFRFLCSNVTEKNIKIKQTFVESIIYSVYLIQNAKKRGNITTIAVNIQTTLTHIWKLQWVSNIVPNVWCRLFILWRHRFACKITPSIHFVSGFRKGQQNCIWIYSSQQWGLQKYFAHFVNVLSNL